MLRQLVTLGDSRCQVQFLMDLNPESVADEFLINCFRDNHCYESELAWVMFRVLRDGDTAIDVGANVGFFTLLMAYLVGASGQVLAFEPGSNNLPSLQRNIDLNGVKNVSVIERPLWCCEEEVTFYLNADNSGGNALFNPANWPANTLSQIYPSMTKMRSTTIDALDIEDARLIKIDTEGAEQKILEGAKKLLGKCRPPYILVEINPHGLAQAECDETTFRKFMAGFGYELFAIHANGSIPALVPRDTRVNRVGDLSISNMLFSDMPSIAAAWPEVMG